MIRLFVALLALLVLPHVARAAEADMYCLTGTSSTGAPLWQPSSSSNPCPGTGGTFNSANTYNTIAASQTAQALTGGGGGATGDYLSHCVIIPASTSPGVFTIYDNSTAIYSFPGGSSSLSNLASFTVPVAALSVSGAWKITTGANISGFCVGKFH